MGVEPTTARHATRQPILKTGRPHRDLTIPTVKHNQPPLGCQPFGLFSGLFTIRFFRGGFGSILPGAIGHDLGDQVQRERLVVREAHGAFA